MPTAAAPPVSGVRPCSLEWRLRREPHLLSHASPSQRQRRRPSSCRSGLFRGSLSLVSLGYCWGISHAAAPGAPHLQHRKLPIVQPTGGVYGFDGSPFPAPIPSPKEGTLVLQMHWDFGGNGDKPTVMRFVPGSQSVVTAHKNGELHWHNTIDSKPADYSMLLDIKRMVYSNRDHGITGFEFDPEYGVAGNNYAYLSVQMQPGYKRLPGVGPVRTSVPFYWGNQGPGGDWANDACPQDVTPPNERFCEHWGTLLRLTIDEVTQTAAVDATLLMNQCGASETHGSGGIRFTSAGDMIIAYGDGSQYDNIEGSQDFGFPQYDACYDPTDDLPQGQFRSQRDGYVHGKIIQIFKDSYQTKNVLLEGADYAVLGRGFRNPFRHFVTADDLLYVADVGSAEALSERIYKTPLFVDGGFNGGWPCIEGVPFDAPGNEAARREFLQTSGNMLLCQGIYDVLGGGVNNGAYLQPLYMYRGGFLDPEYPTLAARGSASISDIFVMPQDALIDPKFKGLTFFSDLTKRGVWYFANDGDQVARVLISGSTMVDSTVDPATGIIYMLDHDNWRSVAVYSAENAGDVGPTQPPVPPAPPAPEAQRCHDPYNYPELEFTGNDNTALLSIGALEYNPLNLIRTRGYNDMMPGPLIRMKACETYHITLENNMGGYPEMLYGTIAPGHNELRDPLITNLHTHGLHTSPVAPGDDPSIAVGVGETYDYEISIPCDHAGGLHWYHPHHHGSSTLQALGGAQGLLVVEDNPWLESPYIPADVANAPEAFLHIQSHEVLRTMNAAAATGDSLYYTEVSVEQNPIFYVINGCDVGGFDLPVLSGGWTRVRTFLSSAEYNVILELESVGNAPPPKMELVALDGVYLSDAPRALPDNKLFYSLSSRVDFLLYIPKVLGDAANYNIVAHWPGSALKQVIGTVTAAPGQRSVPAESADIDPWALCRPHYLMDLTDLPAAQMEPTQRIEVREDVNGILYPEDGTPLFGMTFDTVQQWIIGGTEAHPSHLHVQHMQLQDANLQWPDVPGWFKEGDWFDTISVPGQARVRFQTDRFGGSYFFHCHVYEHSDSGVMATMEVPLGPLGAHPPPSFQKYGSCPLAVPTVAIVPGIVDAEGFDVGGPGIAYEDTSGTNTSNGGNRLGEGVDVIDCPQCDGGFAVNDIQGDEWLRYTVEVTLSGKYSISFKTLEYTKQSGSFHASPGACFAVEPSCTGGEDIGPIPYLYAPGGSEMMVSAEGDANGAVRMGVVNTLELNDGIWCLQICFDNGGYSLDSFALTFEEPEVTLEPEVTPKPTKPKGLKPTNPNPEGSGIATEKDSSAAKSQGSDALIFGLSTTTLIAIGGAGLVGLGMALGVAVRYRNSRSRRRNGKDAPHVPSPSSSPT